MALAGFNDSSKSNLWKETCLEPSSMNDLKKHPYLRASFFFLCNDLKTFKTVLDCDISIADKIAFACRFLDDPELIQFIDSLVIEFTKKGALEGIIITGLEPKGVDIFEQYINITGDVQTATLALSNVVPKKFQDVRVLQWVKMYRELLDIWQLWHQRARLDMARIDVVPPQVYARCNFCNQSLSKTMILPKRGTVGRSAVIVSPAKPQRENTTRQKVTSCPSCSKPLPHCTICLLSFSCTLPSSNKTITTVPFGEWFTWCQTCRHGGHAKHIEEWFSTHIECPVSNCQCKCGSM